MKSVHVISLWRLIMTYFLHKNLAINSNKYLTIECINEYIPCESKTLIGTTLTRIRSFIKMSHYDLGFQVSSRNFLPRYGRSWTIFSQERLGTRDGQHELVSREREWPGPRMTKIYSKRARLSTMHDSFGSERVRQEQGRSGYKVILRRPNRDY